MSLTRRSKRLSALDQVHASAELLPTVPGLRLARRDSYDHQGDCNRDADAEPVEDDVETASPDEPRGPAQRSRRPWKSATRGRIASVPGDRIDDAERSPRQDSVVVRHLVPWGVALDGLPERSNCRVEPVLGVAFDCCRLRFRHTTRPIRMLPQRSRRPYP